MTTTRIYKSTDSGAPVLTGGVSALINLLEKCLVDGYGSKTAAGWTKPFTGTNKAAFRNSVAAGGSGMYLRVDDSGSGTGGAREALLRVYSAMTDVDTGSDATPSAAQVAASIVWRKSNTVDSTARAWILVADELTFYLCIDSGTSSNGWGTFGAGDIASDVPGDAYRAFICGRETQHGADVQGSHAGFCIPINGVTTPTTESMWLCRGYDGSAGAVRAALMYPLGVVRIGASTAPVIANPTPGTGLLYYVPATIATQSAIRGTLRGMILPLNNLAGVAAGTEVVNPPGLARTLVTLRHFSNTNGSSSVHDCHVLVDQTGPW